MLRYNLWNPFSFGELLIHYFLYLFYIFCIYSSINLYEADADFSNRSRDFKTGGQEFPKMASTEWDHFVCH